MKTRTAARTIGLISLLALVFTLGYSSIQVSGDPAPEWVNFFSTKSWYLGKPVPVGAIIAAFDPDGVKCGECTVTQKGKYGLLSCYRDEKPPPPTPDPVDEGAEPGDVISFTINGLPAVATGPDDPIWTSNGDLREVNLQAPVPAPVGGVIVPVNRQELLAPWLEMTATAFFAALTVALLRRRRG
jgi:hypothetical protein